MDVSFVDRIVAAFTGVMNGIADKSPVFAAAAVVLLITWVAGRLTFAATRRVLAKRSTAAHVDVLVARTARAGVILLGLIVALAVLGVDATALAASLGLVGVTLGFAFRDVLANSVSGVLLLVQRPFGIGDSIAVSGVEGVVEDVRVRDTVLRTADGRRAYVPNTTVFNEVVLNSSDDRTRRFEVTVGVPSGADLGEAAGRVLAAVSDTEGVLADPPADAAVMLVGVSRARIVAHGWVDTRVDVLDTVRSAALAAASATAARGGTADS